jgi:SAM-dependent methyltransferase
LLAEAHRVLRPGGRLIITEYCRSSRELDSRDERLIRDWLAGWSIPDIGTPSEIIRWLGEVGFNSVQERDLTSQVRPSARRLYIMATSLTPLGVAFFLTGRVLRLWRPLARTEIQQANVRGARQQWFALQRHLWQHVMFTATKST